MKNFVKAFYEFCEVVNCSAVVDWLQAKCIVGKIFWTLIIVPCLWITVWQLVSVCQEYTSQNKFRTSISLETVSSVPFPNITVCNFNRAQKFRMDQIGLTAEALSYAYGSLPVWYDIPIFDITTYEMAWEQFITNHSEMTNLTKFFDFLGGTCSTTFVGCSWFGRRFNCCDYAKSVFNAYGKCFILSTPSRSAQTPASQNIPGATRGLKIILNASLQNYPPDLVMNNFLEEGFFISTGYVYEPSVLDPVTVPVPVHAYISLTPKVQTFVEPSNKLYHMPCRKEPSLQVLDESYSKENCVFDCKLQNSYTVCGCVPFSRTKLNHPICNASVFIPCLISLLNHSELAECTSNCLPSCEPSKCVTATVSYTTFSNSTWHGIAQMFGNPTSVMDSVSSVDVYFPSLEIITVETSESTTIFTFVSNLGGQLGVFLGMSTITCFQLFYYLFNWFYNLNDSRKPKRIKTVILPRNRMHRINNTNHSNNIIDDSNRNDCDRNSVFSIDNNVLRNYQIKV